MDFTKALENIKTVSKAFPYEEIYCIRENKNEAIPELIRRVRAVSSLGKLIPEDYDEHFFAMYLLAEFRVAEAFPYLLKILEFDEDLTDRLLGDILTEDYGSILATVSAPEDIPKLKQIIENASFEEFNRGAALNALVVLYAEEQLSLADLSEYLCFLLQNFTEHQGFLVAVVDRVSDIYADNCFETVEELFKKELIDTSWISMDDFDELRKAGSGAQALADLRKYRWNVFVRDTVESLSSWACFNPEKEYFAPSDKKTGRNDPCPCKSGKKYKKCCGA